MTAVTVAGGQARVVLPREVPAWRIAVEHPEFFSMYDTRYYRPGPDVLVAYMARKFMIAGEVIDSRGDPVEGARVILVHPSLDAAGKTEDLLHRSLCSTGKNGDFGATLEEGIPAEGFFVASARGWLPQGIKVDPVPPPDGCIHLHFRLQEGRVVEGRFIVRGEEEIPAIRLSLRQATHPLFPEWKVQPMPPRAGEKIGLRVETVTADGKGRFRSPGWPPGAKIQVFIFNPKDHDLVLESVEDGLQLGRRQALVDMALNRRPLFHVFLRRSPRIRVSGRVEGFSAAERAGIRFQVLTLEGRSGYLVRLHWEGCRFHGELSPGASYMDYLQPFRVKMSLPGERNVKFFGPFCLRWETTIGDLFYDRHGDGESRE